MTFGSGPTRAKWTKIAIVQALMTRRKVKAALLGAAAVTVAMLCGWGFTVDDALISTRVAHHLHEGVGYRFNPDGEIVDCVTPLGWAYLLAPLSPLPFVGLLNARLLGVAVTVGWGAVLGARLAFLDTWRLLACLLPLAFCLPVGAWSVSGMETPVVTLLVVLALNGRGSLVFASLAAGLRPEWIPFGFVLAALRPVGRSARHPVAERLKAVLIVLSIPLAVALLRLTVFGHPAPLAVFAKPSDLTSGLRYAVGGAVLLGVPLLLLGFHSWQGQSGKIKALALACATHAVAVAVAGGDWMALFRLFVPLVPVLCFVAGHLAAQSAPWTVTLRTLAALSLCGLLLWQKGKAAQGVWAHREALMHVAAEHLRLSLEVATLDVGWVGAVTRAPIVDLAGVTDVEVALLPGGHTSKQLPNDFLVRRAPDTLVLLTSASAAEVATRPWTELPFARAVEKRLSTLDAADEFVTTASVPLGGTEQRYVIVRRLRARFVRTRASAGEELGCQFTGPLISKAP